MNSKRSNPALIQLIKKKTDSIKKLEEEYWRNIEEERRKLEVIDDDYAEKFSRIFPENIRSLIYGFIDGAVLIRRTTNKVTSNVEIQIFEYRLEYLKKVFPIPTYNGKFININVFLPETPFGCTVTLQEVSAETEVYINYLQYTVLKYDSSNLLKSLSDAVDDVKIALLGLNTEIDPYSRSSERAINPDLINRLKTVKTEFDNLLNTAHREEELQVYLKANPLMIQPHSRVFPKQKLADDFITDFVLASTLSQGIKYTFVEIERANMPIFNKSGDFSQQFNHAAKQTLEWDNWLESNIVFLKTKLPGLSKPNYLIIAGRSSEMNEDNKSMLRAWNKDKVNTDFLTYDDLSIKFGELISNLEKAAL